MAAPTPPPGINTYALQHSAAQAIGVSAEATTTTTPAEAPVVSEAPTLHPGHDRHDAPSVATATTVPPAALAVSVEPVSPPRVCQNPSWVADSSASVGAGVPVELPGMPVAASAADAEAGVAAFTSPPPGMALLRTETAETGDGEEGEDDADSDASFRSRADSDAELSPDEATNAASDAAVHTPVNRGRSRTRADSFAADTTPRPFSPTREAVRLATLRLLFIF
jgi:hypothetical protein